MTSAISDLEVSAIGKRLIRVQAAKAELAKPTGRYLTLFAFLSPVLLALPLGEHLARIFHIPEQALFLPFLFLSILFAALWQITSLQRKVAALTILVEAYAESKL